MATASQQFEYHVEPAPFMSGEKKWQKLLTSFAEQGWRLHTVMKEGLNSPIFVFERPIASKPGKKHYRTNHQIILTVRTNKKLSHKEVMAISRALKFPKVDVIMEREVGKTGRTVEIPVRCSFVFAETYTEELATRKRVRNGRDKEKDDE